MEFLQGRTLRVRWRLHIGAESSTATLSAREHLPSLASANFWAHLQGKTRQLAKVGA